jgi:hypothetical protein
MESLSTGSDTSKVYSGGQAHVCHCIGCCTKCGHCRTDLKHTPEACKEIQRANEIYRKALGYS